MFTLKINTDNAAFGDTETAAADEVVTILRFIASRMEYGTMSAPIRDTNGNTVGQYALEHEPLEEREG